MQYKTPFNYQAKFIRLTLLLVVSFLFAPTSFASDDPIETIKTFYRLIAKQQCEQAIKLRPDYSLTRCKKISKTHIHKVTTELRDDKNAVLLLELDAFYNKKKSYFFGYLRLEKQKGQWLILGPFKSREDYWLDEYVKTYIPGGFKGLSEAEKQKKFAPPPAPGSSSQQNTKKLSKKGFEITPPGDSADAEEFDPQPLPPASKTINTISKKSIPTKKEEGVINPEAMQFISGMKAIEGNYTSLLIKIRKNFPSYNVVNIALVDQSRHTLYIYNNRNLLLNFFPILSSDNSLFPSGMYRISSNIPTKLTKRLALQVSQPIVLNKIEDSNATNNTSTEKKPLYYIRDLFDTNKINSLQLSPIDLDKFYQVISSSTLIYSAQ